MFRRLGVSLVTCLVVAGLGGCGPPEPAGTLVIMYDNQYNAPVTKVPVGTRVSFLNQGGTVHNATAVDGRWNSGDVGAHTAGGGVGGEVVFDSAGVYHYYCRYHGTKDGKGMAGVIVVGDVEYTANPRGSVAPAESPSGVTRRVPADYPTIQAAVDAAIPGDLVLVDKGVYQEEVTVTTPSLVIRGVDRNEVVVDGEFVRGNGIVVLADQVAVENMTARNALLNGFFWSGVTGFRGSYLTAYNNGDYGIYAFGSQDGLLEDSYASGSPDSGFYIGECFPCNAVIRNVIAERNGLGLSATNAGGNFYVVSSVWRYNRAGLVPASLDIELNPPQRSTVFAANLVYSNNNRNAPAITLNLLAFGNGILLAGSVDDTVERNVVYDHEGNGIATAPIQDRNYYAAKRNVIRDNLVLASGRADLVNAGPGATGNCFAGNVHESSVPFSLERWQGCGGFRMPWWSDLVAFGTTLRRVMVAPSIVIPDWKTQPVPPPQPNMPNPTASPVKLARNVFASLSFDVSKATLPPGSDSIVAIAKAGGRVPGTAADGVSLKRAGVLGRFAANAAFLAGPFVVLWWLWRGLRRRPAPANRQWLRRLSVVAGGLVGYFLVYLASVIYYARM